MYIKNIGSVNDAPDLMFVSQTMENQRLLWRGLDVSDLSYDDIMEADAYLIYRCLNECHTGVPGSSAPVRTVPLCLQGLSFDEIDWTALWSMASSDSGEKHPLVHLTDFPLPGNTNVTLLWQAAAVGNVGAVSALIELGADVERCRPEGLVPPLYIAAQNGHFGVCSVLLKSGRCDVDRSRDTQATPLLIATQSNMLPIVRLLLFNGANTELANSQGCTPFVLACSMGHTDIALELLTSGARTESLATGKSAKSWGKINGHIETIAAVMIFLTDRLRMKSVFRDWRRYALVDCLEIKRRRAAEAAVPPEATTDVDIISEEVAPLPSMGPRFSELPKFVIGSIFPRTPNHTTVDTEAHLDNVYLQQIARDVSTAEAKERSTTNGAQPMTPGGRERKGISKAATDYFFERQQQIRALVPVPTTPKRPAHSKVVAPYAESEERLRRLTKLMDSKTLTSPYDVSRSVGTPQRLDSSRATQQQRAELHAIQSTGTPNRLRY